MKRFWFSVYIIVFFGTLSAVAQTAPNVYNSEQLSPNSAAATKVSGMPVNIFTGIPSVSVPLYSYADQNGLSLNISANYFAGGIREAEGPSTLGMGWTLSCGGEITRVVQGAPDDVYPNGFMWSGNIPNDFRNDANKYYYDTLDAAQDVFQFNFGGRSGTFYITKTQQIIIVPLSKLKITFTTEGTGGKRILSFKITTENGTKYIFNDYETTTITSTKDSIFRSAYAGTNYFSAWKLSQIVAPFNTDTIKFNYQAKTVSSTFGLPQTVFVNNSDHSTTTLTQATGTNSTTIKKLTSVNFPNRTNVNFVYGNTSYYGADSVISRIKIADTLFKKGYIFNYTSFWPCSNCAQYVTYYKIRTLLNSITPYTSKQVDKPYTFAYYSPPLADFNENEIDQDSLSSAVDHWGFMNKFNNHGNLIPAIPTVYTGSNRSPSAGIFTNALQFMYLPTGGWVKYIYQSNDRLPYTKSQVTVPITSYSGVTQTQVTLNQVFSTRHQLVLAVDKSVSRAGSPPLSGTVNLQCTLKSTDGATTYKTYTVSFNNLFYTGIKTWTFTQANGNYRLDVQITGGGSVTGSLPINITWENKLTDNSHNADTVGGLRVFQIVRQNADDDVQGYGTLTEEYHYIREDGKSSGFLGDIPKYDYPYRRIEVVSGNNIITDYTGINSEPVSNISYAQGSPVGYSRVEVLKGTATQNLGKIVYEFTDLTDANASYSAAAFPYAPQNIKDWAIGYPKKVSIYDSSGTLIKRTVSQYSFNDTTYSGNDFQSVKFGRNLTTYTGYASATNPPSPKTETYIGQEYSTASGWVSLNSVTDTIFQSDASLQTSTSSFTYDTNYNVIKITSPYDRNRGLQLETRMYYPYNYTIGGKIGKLRDSGIIAPVIATEKWIVGDANPRIVAGSITNYQQLTGGHIKPWKVYSLESNKPVNQSTIGVFDPAQLVRNSTYFKQQASYDVFDNEANLLQMTNTVSNQSASQITDYNSSLVIAKVSNALYADIAYTSFESDGTGNWTVNGTARDTTSSVTGKKSYNLSNGTLVKSGLTTSITYLITVWGKSGATINVNGTSIGASIATHNNWNFYTTTVTGIATVTISGSGLIDEVRLHPKDANMMTSTYDPIVGVTSSCDANNTVIYNEYDGLNRLKVIRDNDKNILKRYDFEDTAIFINVTPGWKYQGNICEATGARYDSSFIDTNFYSDSYNATKLVFISVNNCTCGSNPDLRFKMVNGHCEYAHRYNTATTHFKRYYMDNTYDWIFRCYYHYVWTDNSYSSPDQYEEWIGPHDGSGTGCTLGLMPDE